MKFSTKIQMALFTVLAAVSLVACDNGGGVIQDVTNEANNVARNAQIAQDSMTTLYDDNVTNKCYSAISNAVDCN